MPTAEKCNNHIKEINHRKREIGFFNDLLQFPQFYYLKYFDAKEGKCLDTLPEYLQNAIKSYAECEVKRLKTELEALEQQTI